MLTLVIVCLLLYMSDETAQAAVMYQATCTHFHHTDYFISTKYLFKVSAVFTKLNLIAHRLQFTFFMAKEGWQTNNKTYYYLLLNSFIIAVHFEYFAAIYNIIPGNIISQLMTWTHGCITEVTISISAQININRAQLKD